MKTFAFKDLDVAITELDVETCFPPSGSDIVKQQEQWRNVGAAWRCVERYPGVTIWGALIMERRRRGIALEVRMFGIETF
jgi:GH35 family endo-1,4-beta-xylanase